MKNIFKTPFFIITFVIALLLSLSSLLMQRSGKISPVDNVLGTVLMPFEKAGSSVVGFFGNIGSYFRDYNSIKAENEELKLKIKSMQSDVENADRLKRENDWLYSLLGLTRTKTEYQFEKASVIAYNQLSYLSTFTLDKGSNNGVEKGMAVINENGLVGVITEVGTDYSICTSSINPNFAVSVYTEKTVVDGEYETVEKTAEGRIAMGNFEDAKDACIRIPYLEEGTQIQVGDCVYTEGSEDVYPRGIYVGTVKEIKPDEYTQSLYAVVRTQTGLSGVSDVLIIKGFHETVQEAEE